MKNRRFRRLTALACALALCLTLSPAVSAAEAPAVSKNISKQDYSTTASPVTSYLYANSAGGVTRVEYISGKIVVEDYDSSFHLTSSRSIPMELSKWGGFFAGKDYNFFIFGQNNPQESDSVEVVRIVKYTKSWHRLGSVSVYGANTKEPFHSGAIFGSGPVRCAESGDFLYIRTSHLMYKSNDGKNHQASMMFQIDEKTMTVKDSLTGIGGTGYVSHSFNQFILVDQEQNLVTADHGDGYPRAIELMRYEGKAGSDGFISDTESIIQEFPGNIGYNYTGAALGGLAETSSGYVTAYNYDGIGGSNTFERHAYIGYTSKNGLASTTRKISTELGASTPRVYPTSLNGGYIAWNQYDQTASNYMSNTLYYISYSADGSVGELKKTAAMLSDCQPVLFEGKLVWYAGMDAKPDFYTLDASGVTKHTAGIGSATSGGNPFTDVAENAYYYDAVLWALKSGVTTGVTANQFQPKAACTRGQVVTFLWRAMGSPEPKTTVNPFTDVPSTSAFYKAVLWAYENQITSGDTATTFNPTGTCTNGHVITFLWRAKGEPAAAKSSALAQKYPDAYYTNAIAWADSTGILTGIGAAFNPTVQASRADIVTYLYHDLAG